ncbi:fasciclin domain-containing protein, partial [Bacteroidota bacterium]
MSRKIILLFFMGVLLLGCKKEIEKFQRPEWLEGKMFTQIKAIPDADIFVQCLQISGYDTIIEQSGSYTVFVPDNNAFSEYFASHPQYSSVDDMSYEAVREIVRTHIIQNPWSRYQLQSLDINGWIDEKDPYNNEPWGYKRETLQKDPNRKYFIHVDNLELITIVDSTESNDSRMVFKESRKFIPLFFDEYMSLGKVTSSDFDFYFNRPFEAGNIYYKNAKLLPGKDEYAENGFIYVIDQVVKPLKNAEELLESSEGGHSYKQFLETIYQFPFFFENVEATNDQPGADQGLEVPTLYYLAYPDLTFGINFEWTGKGNIINPLWTIRYHYGLMAPTDAAMKWLEDNILTDKSGLPHWPNWDFVPLNIKQIIVNAHMSESPIYLSDVRSGFLNGEQDSVYMDENDIIETVYGSNATFMGIDKPIIPRALSSVTGPLYLRPGYKNMMYAMEYANVLPAVKRIGQEYSFFVVSDAYLEIDSSLTAEPNILYPGNYTVTSHDKLYRPARETSRRPYEIAQMILNQVGTETFSGIPRKEFVKTLGSNYICYNSVDNIVNGGIDMKLGWNGDSTIYRSPVKLEESTDNGETYRVDGFFTFPQIPIYQAMRAFPHWYDLLSQAGMVDYDRGLLTFLNEAEYHTVLVPSQRAIQN